MHSWSFLAFGEFGCRSECSFIVSSVSKMLKIILNRSFLCYEEEVKRSECCLLFTMYSSRFLPFCDIVADQSVRLMVCSL